jgi:hypothetical protein
MSITVNPGGSISIDGAEDVAFFKLLTLQRALTLETKGLKMSRRMSALKAAKLHYGIKARTAAKALEIVNGMVAAEKAKRGAPVNTNAG